MIFSRHSVLKRGCSVWDRQAMPEAEYQGRLESVRQQMVQDGLDALVIYGDNYSFADLCYLTNYFPKVRGGLAIIPRSGSLSLLLNIGSRDVPFAKSLTWVEDVRASGQLGRDGAEAIKERGLAQSKLGLMDSGKGFPLAQLEDLKESLPQVQWQPCHSMLQQMRLQKSAKELTALRAAGQVLNEILEGAREFIQPGRGEYEIVADIDRLARDKGVEDIRILAGERRLQPPSFKMTVSMGKHWALYLAIQHERYWSEIGRTYVLSSESKLQNAYRRAQEVVAQMAAQMKPGSSVTAIDETARKQLGEFFGSAVLYGLGNGIGLDQWEEPYVGEEEARRVGAAAVGVTRFNENMSLALRVAFDTEGKLILFGDSYEVTPEGPKSLTQG
ncbi:MAG TPA: M24 family metallopeptidase [Terriglobales bacterium]|nr:M24 family metallopeptidase [Terriglobales bacterium]